MVQWLGICFLMQRQRFHPYSGKVPHAKEHLSRGAITTKACMPGACAQQREKPPRWEVLLQLESRLDPLVATPRESPLQQRRPSTAKNKQNKILKTSERKKQSLTTGLKCRRSYSPRTPDSSILWNMRVRDTTLSKGCWANPTFFIIIFFSWKVFCIIMATG